MQLNKTDRASTSSSTAGAPAFWPASGSGVLAGVGVLLLLLSVGCGSAPDPGDESPAGEWRHYAADRASTKYSPLDQINPSNVDRLREVWRWTSVETEADTEFRGGMYKSTPLYIDGTLYITTSLSQVAAIDPGTGETRWVYDPRSYDAGRPANAGFQQRGLEYWRGEIDGEPTERLIYAAHHRRLISLDRATGQPDPAFGDGGMVNTAIGLGREINERQYTHSAPPVVCADVIVLGSVISDGPRGPKMPPGHVRGYDVRTGEMRWIFHTIPQPGEFGNETWLDGSWEYSGNTNVWTMMSCDDELGFVYLPVSTPTNDWYGGHRRGDNLFAESLVALDARTGERKWHFQAVRHGLWDYDLASAPNLVDITVDGREIEAVALVSKQGLTYVFDRETGEPVWPIDEIPVPQTAVPGEWTSATQPMPTKPAPFERLGMTEDDLIDFTPELRAEALEIAGAYVLGPIFTPPLEVREGGKLGVLTLPSAAGGANWRGAAVDPEAGVLYVPSMTKVMSFGVQPADAARSEFRYVDALGLVEGPRGLPLVKPPYSRITAIDLNTGEHLWQVAHGPGPKDHPAIAHLGLPDLGSASHGILSNGGLVLTKDLIFIIQADYDPSRMTFMGDAGHIRAYDKRDGAKLWEHRVEPTPHGTPMTYLHEGRQYVAFTVGAGRWEQTPALVALALE